VGKLWLSSQLSLCGKAKDVVYFTAVSKATGRVDFDCVTQAYSTFAFVCGREKHVPAVRTKALF